MSPLHTTAAHFASAPQKPPSDVPRPTKAKSPVSPPNNSQETPPPTEESQAPKNGRRFTTGLYIYGGFLCLAIAGTMGYKTLQFWRYNEISLIYLGRGPSFDESLDETVQFPISSVTHYFNLVQQASKFEKRLASAERLKAEYPTSVIPELLLSHVFLQNQDLEEAEKHLQEAHRLLDEAPGNEGFRSLFPIQPIAAEEPAPVMEELKEGRIWTVLGKMKTNSFPSQGVIAQSAIVKLKDGSLVIFNPIAFSDQNIAQINELGPVRALITPTRTHHEGIELAHQIWPEAQMLAANDGVKQFTEDRVAWDKFLYEYNESNTPTLYDELLPISNMGNTLREIVVYDPESRTLLGPTDSLFLNPLYSPFPRTLTDVCMALGCGFFRGDATREYACPNSMIANTHSQKEYASFLKRLYALEVDTIVLSHGGVVHESARKFMKPVFSWVQYVTLKLIAKWLTANSRWNLL